MIHRKFIGALIIGICLPIISHAQRLEPTQGFTQPKATTGNSVGAQTVPQQQAGNVGTGIQPLTGVGQQTPGVGNQTTGYGNQIKGYGNTNAVKGLLPTQGCNTYPPDPYKTCP